MAVLLGVRFDKPFSALGQNSLSLLTLFPQSGQNGIASTPTYGIPTTNGSILIPWSLLLFKYIILELAGPVNTPQGCTEIKLEDSLGVHRRIGKAIHKVKIRLDEPGDEEALSCWFKSSRGQFYIRGPEPKG